MEVVREVVVSAVVRVLTPRVTLRIRILHGHGPDQDVRSSAGPFGAGHLRPLSRRREGSPHFERPKDTFFLDGKLAPAKIAVNVGRHAVLCHYRSEKTPHKILVRSRDDTIRGTLIAMNEKTLRLVSPIEGTRVILEKDAQYQVAG